MNNHGGEFQEHNEVIGAIPRKENTYNPVNFKRSGFKNLIMGLGILAAGATASGVLSSNKAKAAINDCRNTKDCIVTLENNHVVFDDAHTDALGCTTNVCDDSLFEDNTKLETNIEIIPSRLVGILLEKYEQNISNLLHKCNVECATDDITGLPSMTISTPDGGYCNFSLKKSNDDQVYQIYDAEVGDEKGAVMNFTLQNSSSTRIESGGGFILIGDVNEDFIKKFEDSQNLISIKSIDDPTDLTGGGNKNPSKNVADELSRDMLFFLMLLAGITVFGRMTDS